MYITLTDMLIYKFVNPKHIIFVYFFNVPATTEIYTLSLHDALPISAGHHGVDGRAHHGRAVRRYHLLGAQALLPRDAAGRDRKSTRLNSSHVEISYAVFCLKKKIKKPLSG